jgi:pimeloyl-ACP methyl ester carboxylesterase
MKEVLVARDAARASRSSERRTAIAATHGQKRVGRFRERPGLKVLRTICGVLSGVAPGLAGRIGYALLSRPPSAPERGWQTTLRSTAKSAVLRYGTHRLATYEWGSGPTILMVHGWGARATHMGKMIEPLVLAGFRVVSFDAPAHGLSSGRTTDLVEYADAIHRVTAHFGQPQVIIAHSFGSAMALSAMRDWCVKPSRIVLISSFDHCLWFSQAFGSYLGIRPNAVLRMQQLLSDRYSGRFDWKKMSVVEMLRGAKIPALLIHDQDDEEIPYQHSVRIRSDSSGVELFQTQGLGHHRLLGNAAVIKRVVQFVAQN